MKPIPLIVGFGGLSSAGKSVFHTAYQRIIIEELNSKKQQETYASLACMMGLVRFKNDHFICIENGQKISLEEIQTRYKTHIKKNTLIRKLENFYQQGIPQNLSAKLKSDSLEKLENTSKDELWGDGWKLIENNISFQDSKKEQEVFLAGYKKNKVNVAGSLPLGFDASSYYTSLHHPKHIQLAILGVSDALRSVGIDWQELPVKMDKIGVYCGSCLGGADLQSMGGLLQMSHLGKRPSSKMLAFSMQNMISDFINAYVLGSVGITNCSVGACATFLYNLSNAVDDIRSKKIEVAVVGSSEAPITPEVIEGYRVMSALAEDEKIKKKNSGKLDYNSACRPFGDNYGFVLAEGCQFIVLFSDELVCKIGVKPYAAVGDIFVSSDGYKGSISQPGIGNYVTFAKATALAKKILGKEKLQKNTYIQAHGTGTPQNRVTESHILNETAKAFDIQDWMVSAIKTYLGHSTGPAAGDQLIACLGAWEHEIIAGIEHTPEVAEDVYHSHLNILLQNENIKKKPQLACLINSKGFGGNNATGLFFSPNFALELLEKKYTKQEFSAYRKKADIMEKSLVKKKDKLIYSSEKPIYSFQKNVLAKARVEENSVSFKELGKSISLDVEDPYK